MKRRYRINKKYLIVGLFIVLLVMSVGYAAFSTSLSITGTGSISTSWNIEITDITTSDIVGSASNDKSPSYDKLSATFSTNLVSPGDSITYNIKVENKGSLDAMLDKISLVKTDNPAIKYETSGISEGDILYKNTSSILKVKVTYNENVTMQPINLNADIEVTLDYVQNSSGTTPSATTPTIDVKGVDVALVTTGDGLYKDDTVSYRYVYKGVSPNNYIKLGNDMYRIIALENDGTLKVIKNEKVGNIPFDPGYSSSISNVTAANSIEGTRYSSVSTDYCYQNSGTEEKYYGCNVWGSSATTLDSDGNHVTKMPISVGGTLKDLPEDEAYLNTYLNGTWYISLSTDVQNLITTHMFNVGSVKYNVSSQTLDTDITQESTYKWNGKVGLMNPTDYVKSNSNIDTCGTVYLSSYWGGNYETCKTTTWIYNDIANNANYPRTIVPLSGNSYNVWLVSSDTGSLYDTGDARYGRGAVPVFYLSSAITLDGSGTSTDPYIPSLE
jgi:hypothetical protein